ncbi:MAG: putative baseplate assembly protein [Pseudomonadota bacterium]
MTLPLPRLDTRTYEDLVAEALRRLPLHTPEYTDHNQSDPGRAIIEANAFLLETLLYQINRVPDQSYLAFLDLVGIAPRPATAAHTDLAFTLAPLDKDGDPLLVDIPRGTQVAVDAPDLEEEVIFETDRSHRALNADFGLALVPEDGPIGQWRAITRFDSEGDRSVAWLHAFHPFGEAPEAGRSFVFALALRPKADTIRSEDRMPGGALGLFVEATQVFDTAPDGSTIEGPLSAASGPLGASPDALSTVKWEAFAGGEANRFRLSGKEGWQEIGVQLDETDGLTRSGHLTLSVPAGMIGVRLGATDAEFWPEIGQLARPRTAAALTALLREGSEAAADIKAGLTDDVLLAIGVPADELAGLASTCETAEDLADALDAIEADLAGAGGGLTPSALSQAQWADLSPSFAAPDTPTIENDPKDAPRLDVPLYFFRATLREGADPALLNRLRLNTVPATAASTRKDERLGVSNGRPAQTMRVGRTPIYFDPDLERADLTLTVTAAGTTETWEEVADFYGQGPAAKVFTLDPISGEITFGDGRARGVGGAIPPADAVIRAARYRFGGGAVANVASRTVSAIKGALRGVEAATNPRAAAGGTDAESLEDVKRRAPSTLRRRERAVSAQDFADLARETPGAAIHKAYAVAAQRPDGIGFAPSPGTVSVVVLPAVDHPTPQPTQAVLAAVSDWLNPRRLVTTELCVIGPRYQEISLLSARLRVETSADFSTVTRAAEAALTTWLHPIRGGADGAGWPFGGNVFHGDLYDVLLGVDGVRHVSGLQLVGETIPGAPDEFAPSDVLEVPEGYLPSLAAGAIRFEVSYV